VGLDSGNRAAGISLAAHRGDRPPARERPKKNPSPRLARWGFLAAVVRASRPLTAYRSWTLPIADCSRAAIMHRLSTGDRKQITIDP
jgi:hypothetical protein